MDNKALAMIDKYGVTDNTRAFLQAGHQQMFIGGRFVDSVSMATSPVEDPATGALLMTVPCATTEDVDLAVSEAQKAFTDSPWSRMTPGERQGVLLRLADVMESHAQTLAELEAIDAGKAISGCLDVDVMGAARINPSLAFDCRFIFTSPV